VHVEDSGSLDFNWKIKGGHYQKQTVQSDNLLILEDTTITTNGITLVVKDGVITINGTPTASTNIDFKIKKKLKAGTYWHMVNRASGSASGNIGFLIMKSISSSATTINGSGGANFTLEEDTEAFYRIWTDKNNTISNVAYKCLISEGSDSKPWVQGIPDSPSLDYPSVIETAGSNANLFDGELESGSLANNSGQNYANAKNTRSKNYIAVEENTTYVLSDNIKGSFIVHAYDENKNWLSMIGAQNYTGQYIFVTPPQTSYIRFRTNETDLTAKIKLEKGSIATPYSPYGMGSVEIDVVNKNIFDGNKAVEFWRGFGAQVEFVENVFKVNAVHQSLYSKAFKIIDEVKNLTLSVGDIINDTGINARVGLCTIKEDGTINNRTVIYQNQTITKNANAIYFDWSKAGAFTVKEIIVSVNENTITNDYVPHKSQTAIMPIQQEMLEGDYVADVEHHEWGKLVLTGNENFVQAQNANKLNYFYLGFNVVKIKGKIISNMLKNIESGIIWNKTSSDDVVSSASNSKTINIMLSDTTITTLQQFKEKLKELYNAGTPIIIYYELAEPIDLELTSEQKVVRNQKLYTYKNITNISLSDELASIDVEYKKDQDTINKNYENRLAALEAASIS
jgi:hypothetical protein